MYTKTESRTVCQAHTLQQNVFRLTVGADAGKPPLDQVSLTLCSLSCRFCTVKLSFVVSMNWMSIKPLAGPQASKRHKETGIHSSKKIKQKNQTVN